MAGGAGAALCFLGLLSSPFQFYRSYLWSYLFVVGVSVGSLAWLMLQYLTGGAWGVVIRRPCEAAARTLPLVALMFLPIVIGIPNLYPWSHPNIVAADAVLRHKHVYLNVPFFLVRAAVYFAGWMLLSWYSTAGPRWKTAKAPAARTGRMAAPGRSRPGLLGLQRHLHGHRLGALARSALVLHHVRHALHGGPGALVAWRS